MIEIDGSYGEGGGQILRTSLSLAALTGRRVHFTRIRAGRPRPGLMRQHLACVKAVAEITGGTLDGAELNAQELTFAPGKIRAGAYRFVVGSAGSAVLIAQTVLPCLLRADGGSTVVIEGGTHAANAPIFDFLERVYLPCLRRMGAEVSVVLDRIGFYPAGGGAISLAVKPVKNWRRLEIMTPGALQKARLVVLSHGIDAAIGEDELRCCRAALEDGLDCVSEARTVESPGPGNVMFAELEFENITELFSVCGAVEISRREVGRRVACMVNRFRGARVPVWRFLADQLLLPMAIGAGGKYLTTAPSRHTRTNIDVIGKFLDVAVKLETLENGRFVLEVIK